MARFPVLLVLLRCLRLWKPLDFYRESGMLTAWCLRRAENADGAVGHRHLLIMSTRATSSLPPRLEKQFSINVQVSGRGRTIIGSRAFGKHLK
jgi:hypothetical protein